MRTDLLNPANGFWLCAAPTGICDQTFDTLFERSRFYAKAPDSGIKESLSKLDQTGDMRREGEIASSFALAHAEAMKAGRDLAPGSKGLARRERKAGKGSWRDSVDLSFIHFDDPTGSHWGALLIIFANSAFLPSRHDDFWKASEPSRSIAERLSVVAAETVLDELAKRWQLGEPLIRHERNDSRAHWAEDWPPSCLDPESNRQAACLAESWMIGRQIDPLAASIKKTSPSL